MKDMDTTSCQSETDISGFSEELFDRRRGRVYNAMLVFIDLIDALLNIA